MMWMSAKLGDVCNIINGSTPSRKEPRYWDNGNILWFTIDDLRTQGREITTTAQKITTAAMNETSVKLIPANSVLLCCTASVGEVAIARTEMATNQQFNALVPKTGNLLPEYLYYFASTLKEKLLAVSGSATINFVAISKLKNISILVPPLAEQQRIVAKLDAAFAEVDETLSLTQSKIDELEKLITSCLKELGNINDAEEFTINTLCKELYAGGDAPSKDKRSLTRTDRFKIPIFSNGSENKGLYGYCEEARTVEPAITISARGTIGHIELRHEPFLPIVRLIVAIPNIEIVLIKFLKYALLGSKIFSSGSSIPQLTVPMLRELPLRIPNLPTQKEIISKLDMIFELREKFQSIQNKKLVQLSALKSAFLAQELQSEAA